MKTQIIWNGCDGYITVDHCHHSADFTQTGSGWILTKGPDKHESFWVESIDPDTVERDDDGDIIMDGGLFMTTDFQLWREIP